MGLEIDNMKGHHVWEAVENFTMRSIVGRVVVEPPTKATKKGRVPRVVKKPERWYFCHCGRAYMNKKRLQEHNKCHQDVSSEEPPVAQKEKRKRANDEEDTASLHNDGAFSPSVLSSPESESRESFDGPQPEPETDDLYETHPCTLCDSVLSDAQDLKNHTILYHAAGNPDAAMIAEVDFRNSYRSSSFPKSLFGSDISKSPMLSEILDSPDPSLALCDGQSFLTSLFEDIVPFNMSADCTAAGETGNEQFDSASFTEDHRQDSRHETNSTDYSLVEEVLEPTDSPIWSNFQSFSNSSTSVPPIPPILLTEIHSKTPSSELQQSDIPHAKTSDKNGYDEIATSDGLLCVQCNRKFHSKASLRLHMKKNHVPNGFRCKYCQCTFKSSNSVIGHLVVNHPDASPKDFLPPLAQNQITAKEVIQQIEIFTCSLCNYVSTNHDELKSHHRQQHSNCPTAFEKNAEGDMGQRKDLSCDHCGIQFKRPAEAVSHKERHHVVDGHFPCKLCACVYNDDSSLQVHHHLKHGDMNSKEISLNVLDGPPPPQNRLKFVCTLCGRSYSQFSGLKAHKTISHKQNGISCPSCSCQFDSEKDFDFHRSEYHKTKLDVSSFQFSETQSRPRGRPKKSYRFSCQYVGCDYVGSVQSDLSDHIQGIHIKGHKKMVQASPNKSAYNTRSQQLAADPGLSKYENEKTQRQRDMQDEPVFSLPEGYKRSFRSTFLQLQCTMSACLPSRVVDSEMRISSEEESFHRNDPLQVKQHADQTEDSIEDVIPVITSVESLRDYEKPKQPTCELCGQVFLRPRSLWSHRKRSHVVDGMFRCSYCSCNFRSERNLTTHMLIYHARRMERVNYPRESWSIKCQDCGDLAKTRRRLASHKKRAHARRGDFSCADCYCVFDSHTALVVHRLQRHRSKYVLGQIDKASNFSDSPKRTRPSDSPSCNSSGDVSNSSHNSTPPRHTSGSSICSSSSELPKQPQQVFQCNACALKFSHVQSLKNHQNVRHGLKKTCQLCNLSFLSRDELLAHTNAAHSLLQVPVPRVVADEKLTLNRKESPEKVENLNTTNTESLDSKQLDTPSSPAESFPKAPTESLCSNDEVNVITITTSTEDSIESDARLEALASNPEPLKDASSSPTGPPKSKRTSWECMLCNITFRKKYRLAVHKCISHCKPARFSCDKCQCTFRLKYAQQIHFQYAHSKQLSKSTSKNKKRSEGKQGRQLEVHELKSINVDSESASNDDAVTCEEIFDKKEPKKEIKELTVVTQNRKQREENKKLRMSKYKPLEGANIEKGFFTLHRLRKHGVVIGPSEGMHQCQICGIKFRRAFLLHRHARINHPGSPQYLCERCPLFTSLSGELAYHENMFHSDFKSLQDFLKENRLKAPVPKHSVRSKKPAQTNYPFDINNVIASFTESNGLFEGEQGNKLDGVRRQRIRRFGIYSCRLCRMMFLTKLGLSSHLRSHVGVKPYNCPFCLVNFRLYGPYVTHKKRHLSLKILSNEDQADRPPQGQCPYCQAVFKSLGLIEIHIEEVHPEFKFLEMCKQASVPWEEASPEFPIMPSFDTLFSS